MKTNNTAETNTMTKQAYDINDLEVIYTDTNTIDGLTTEQILHKAWIESGAYINESFADYKTNAFKIEV